MVDRVTDWSRPPVTHRVYVRRVADGLKINGELDGWLPAPDLVCRKVTMRTGVIVARAEFDVVMKDGTTETAEVALQRYRWDDQVKVVVDPLEDPGFEQPFDQQLGDRSGRIFEGFIAKQRLGMDANERDAEEASQYMALPMPWLDQEAIDHKIIGRWWGTDNYDESPAYHVAETPMLPAVFNFRGRPNMHGEYQSSLVVPSSGEQILAGLWTDDEDPNAKFWTIRDAINAILHAKVFGLTKILNRNIDVEYNVAQMLATAPGDGVTRPRPFVGIDANLPEVDVQGMGPIEALDAVCKAGGFEMAIIPTDATGISEIDEAGDVDRAYHLRLWRRGVGNGNLRSIKLAKRGTTYETAELLHAANNTDSIVGDVDASECQNDIVAIAKQYVEARFDLKPLWKPSEMSDDGAEVYGVKPEDSDLADEDTYWSKHVAGGGQFKDFRHVGRHWGLDGRGDFDGYETGEIAAYAHGDDAFDFPTYLGLNSGSNPSKFLWSRDDDIVWMKRTRRALPLMNPDALGAGMKYFVEVSVDSGSTWSVYSGPMRSLQDYFGIELSIPNLGRFSIANGNGSSPSESLWKKILDGVMRVRVTCCVVADNAPRYHAKIQPTSGTAYSRGQLLPVEFDELLVGHSTINPFNPDSSWRRYVGPNLNSQPGRLDLPTGSYEPIKPAADRHQAKLEDVQWAVNAATAVMDKDAYQLGDLISGIDGRDIRFVTGRAGERRYPCVVGLVMNLGVNDQSIELDIDDTRFAGGR